ncbi:MAG: hypothetical protein NT069_13810, partial [Planctomycetota bacterium]|nr:hypothetical protein [Planctomycetota bacterium]
MPRLCPDCGQSIRDAIPADAPCPYCGPIASAGGTLRFNAADYAALETTEPAATEPSIHNTIDLRGLPEEEAEQWHQTFQQLATPPEVLGQTTEIPSGFLPNVESAAGLEAHGDTVSQEIGDSAQTGSAFRSSSFDLKGSRPTIVTRQLADPEQTPTGDT